MDKLLHEQAQVDEYLSQRKLDQVILRYMHFRWPQLEL